MEKLQEKNYTRITFSIERISSLPKPLLLRFKKGGRRHSCYHGSMDKLRKFI